MERDSVSIVLFTPSLTHGGAERAATLLANAFANGGHRVTVLTATAGDDLSQFLQENVTYQSLGAGRVLSSIPRVASFLRTARPDYTISFLTHANVAMLLANELAGHPTQVIPSEHETVSVRKQGIKEEIILWLAARIYPRAYRIVAVSEGLKSEINSELGVSKNLIHAIPNPVSIPTTTGRATAPHPWFAESSPVIVAAGRHEPVKDYAMLLRAIHELRESCGFDARLILLGEGSETEKLEKLVVELELEDAVTLPGFVDEPYPYYEAADLLVVSSRWEGFGNVLVEAMAVGTPVVSTDCPVGPSEIMAGGEYGQLVPVGDPRAMAAAIQRELQDPTSPDRLIERAEEFSADEVAARYAEIFFTK